MSLEGLKKSYDTLQKNVELLSKEYDDAKRKGLEDKASEIEHKIYSEYFSCYQFTLAYRKAVERASEKKTDKKSSIYFKKLKTCLDESLRDLSTLMRVLNQ